MRLFIAINFDAQIKDKLCNIITSLKPHTKSGSFTRRENLHLTLVFIGETGNIKAASTAIEKLSFDSFSIELSDIGRFRREGGDILWAGIKKAPKLFELQKMLSVNLAENGFKLEKRKYNPHLTLARRVTPLTAASDFYALNKELSEIKIPVDKVSLMNSERINGILTYTEIYSKSS